MKIKIFLLILPITASLFCFFFASNAKAAEFSTSQSKFVVTIAEESTSFEISTVLKNDKDNKLIGGYNIVVPRTKIENLSVKLADQPVTATFKDLDEFYSEIVIDFGNQVIKNGESKDLKMNYSSKDFLKKNGDFKYSYLKSPSDPYQSYSIRIDSDLGLPSYVSSNISFEEDASGKFFTYSSESISSFLVYWGNSYSQTYSTEFTLNNDSDNEVNSLITLPTDSKMQEIEYSQISSAKYGLYDSNSNQFAVVNLQPDSSEEISFQFRVSKNTELSEVRNLEISNNILESLDFYGEIEKVINSESSDLEKIEAFNLLLQSKYSIVFKQSEYKTISEFESYIKSAKEINSLDISILNCNLINKLNQEFKCQIDFGYLNLYLQDNSEISPTFWNIVEIDAEKFVVDGFGSSVFDLGMYGNKDYLDRVKFGTWVNNISYADALGYFHSDGQFQRLSLAKSEIDASDEQIEMFVQPKSANVYSGFYHSFNFTIDNKTNRFITIKNLEYGSISQQKSITLNNNLRIALLPLQENQFQLSKFRNINFFDKGIREVDFTVELDDESVSKVESSVRINYKVYDEAIIAFLILFNFILFIVAFALWKFYFRKKQ